MGSVRNNALNTNRAILWNGAVAPWVDLHAYLPPGYRSSAALGIWHDVSTTYVVGYGTRCTGITEALMWLSVPTCFTVSGDHDAVACPAGATTLRVTATGMGPFTYQWRFNAAPIDAMANPSAATDTLLVTDFSAAKVGWYDCVVTSACGSVTSSNATRTMCAVDFDCTGSATIGDIFSMVAAWFAHDPRADWIADGQFTISDIFGFLSAWFAGCNFSPCS